MAADAPSSGSFIRSYLGVKLLTDVSEVKKAVEANQKQRKYKC